MIRDIVTDTTFLARPATDADPSDPLDAALGRDLADTLKANRERCVGMAANMIGGDRRVIAFVDQELGGVTVMFNPRITAADGLYDTSEGCLSLHGERRTTRARRIEVDYVTRTGKPRHTAFTGYTAQIVQHEVDHCDGVLI
ncbi:MAG: peptide deformylase [Bifidobacterium sp.]|nr:peptide deformylase [Bifidobacterium sp.]